MSSAAAPAIEVRGLSFAYPDGTPALDGVDLVVAPGERVAVLGPNGAGKTTLALHLNGLLGGGPGSVAIGGRAVTGADRRALLDIRRRVGLVFQDPDDQLFMPTVHQDVAFGPANLGLTGPALAARVAGALAAVGLPDVGDRPPHHLSYGQRRRVALATVLAMDPEVLVLDEPTANLDPASRRGRAHRPRRHPRPALRPRAVPAVGAARRRSARRRRAHRRAAGRRRPARRPPPRAPVGLRPGRPAGRRRLTRRRAGPRRSRSTGRGVPCHARAVGTAGLVFDFDGTILDTERSVHVSWTELWAEHGHELSRARWQSIIGTEHGFDPWAELERLVGHPLDPSLQERRRARRDEDLFAQEVRPGVLAWLDEADRLGVPVAIASSSPPEWVDGHLVRLGLLDRFAFLACCDGDVPSKPDPTSFRLACEAIGADPACSVAVEDSPHGIAAAVAAGLLTVAVPHPLTADLDLSVADLVVESLADLALADVLARSAARSTP
jgi:cobalt/nickel transport system ATP-binding protein